MKTKFINVLPALILLFNACNNGDKKNENESGNTGQTTDQHVTSTDDKEVKSLTATYPITDAKLAQSLKEVVDHYIHIKNGLAADNSREAGNGAKEMENALKSIDKSLFTAEQKKIYDDNEEELREHAEHIGNNKDDIKHQRDHFSSMSEVMYNIVRSFGGGRPLYHDHCPMYKEDKGGAMWLSETKEVKNPYFGSQMLKCGTVEELIK